MACDQLLQRRVDPGCPRCGEPVLAPGAACTGDHVELRNLVRHVAPFRYAGTGGVLVRRFKLDGDAAAGWVLARAMTCRWLPWARGNWRRALFVPVPLHRRRRRDRGFDQAEWLARIVAERCGGELGDGVLHRRRATLPQGDPRVLSRSGNVEGAFAVACARRVRGRAVVLVDDVFTSGATGRACAAVLREAGAAQVAMLTACRS